MSRRRSRRKLGDVELNLAAMLDMAFQLLTFFILTFKPAPMEGHILLRLPPPAPVTNVDSTQQAGEDTSNPDPVQGMESLVVSVFATPGGEIDSLAIGESNVSNLGQLESRLRTVLADEQSGFEQVIIQVSSALHYEQLMKVLDVCTRQKLASGQPLVKLSFVELPEAPAAE